MRKRTSSLPPPSPRMATFSPAAPRRCVRTCSRVLFLAILCLLGTLVLSLLSSIMRGPRHAPASPYHNASERLNFECPANASYPTYRNHSDLKTENEVLKWMGSRFFEMTYSDVEEVNAPFVPFVPGSDSHRFKAYNDRADSVKEDSAPIPVVNPNADKGNKGEKDAERVFGVKKMMADVNPARNRRDGYSREAEIDLAPGIEGLAEGGMIHRRDEQEKKIMAWHGFGDVAADEDNSENAWRDTDEDWKPRKMQGQKNSWNFGGYDSASNILNSSAVVMEPFKPESYLNGHRGCNENLRGVLGRFRLNFNVVDPRKIAKYGMSRGDARHLVDNGWVQAFCGAVDVIIVADTVPDARGILLSLLEKDESKRCKSKIIIEMTNRFDWLVPDSHDYVNMLRKLIKHPPKNLWWTANNPFEAAFMANQVGMIPNVTLLRSLGAWDVDSQIKTKKSFIQKFLELTGLNWNEVRFRKEIDEVTVFKSQNSLHSHRT
ncbi:hypothetical protein BC830DRAFT_369814 [Chytriomyces sp. MP71]|nr:hypothetical protein BC830DRAFT_369814 [Chytriomyces sp. MP71]